MLIRCKCGILTTYGLLCTSCRGMIIDRDDKYDYEEVEEYEEEDEKEKPIDYTLTSGDE